MSPTSLDMIDDRLGFVLRQNVYGSNSGVNQITQDEIDDAVAATKRNCGFGAVLSQWLKAFSIAARHYEGENAARNGDIVSSVYHFVSPELHADGALLEFECVSRSPCRIATGETSSTGATEIGHPLD